MPCLFFFFICCSLWSLHEDLTKPLGTLSPVRVVSFHSSFYSFCVFFVEFVLINYMLLIFVDCILKISSHSCFLFVLIHVKFLFFCVFGFRSCLVLLLCIFSTTNEVLLFLFLLFFSFMFSFCSDAC